MNYFNTISGASEFFTKFHDQTLIETDESEYDDWFKDWEAKAEEICEPEKDSILSARRVSQNDLPKRARLSKEKCKRIYAEVLQAIQSGSIKEQRNYRQHAGTASKEELRAFAALEGIDSVLREDVNKLLQLREQEDRHRIKRQENRQEWTDIEKQKRARLYSIVSNEMGTKRVVPSIKDLQAFLAKEGIDPSVRKGAQSLLHRKEKDFERHEKRRKIESSE